MVVALVLLVVGLLALVVSAALVEPHFGWAMAGLACLVLACWPAIRAWLMRAG